MHLRVVQELIKGGGWEALFTDPTTGKKKYNDPLVQTLLDPIHPLKNNLAASLPPHMTNFGTALTECFCILCINNKI